MPRDKADTYAFLLLLIFTVAFFLEPIVSDVTFYFRDLFHWCYPAKIFFVEELKNGRFPLWNPYQFLGTPYAANISMSVFYPLNILFFILPFQDAFKYHIIIHYFLYGLFNYMFLRGLRLSPFSSLLASLVLIFSGYLVLLHSQPIFLQSAIWLPLILHFFIKTVDDNTEFKWIALTSVALSVQCLGGNPQDVLISLIFMLFVGFQKVLSDKKKIASAITLCKVFGAVGVLSLGLSTIQLLPASEFVSLTSRGAGLSFDQATVYSFNPVRILEFVLSFPFGKLIPDNTYYGQFLINSSFNLPWTLSVYMGLLPLFFVPLSVLRKKSISYLFMLLSFFFLLVSFGKYTPIYYICYKIIPGFDLFRYPEKYLIAVTFSLAVLCGIGCDSFFKFNSLLKHLSLKGHSKKTRKLKTSYCVVERWIVLSIVTISASYVILSAFDSLLINCYNFLFKAIDTRVSSEVASRVFLESLSHFTLFSLSSLLLFYAYRKGFIRKLLFQTLVLVVLFADIAITNKSLVYYTPYHLYNITPQIVDKVKDISKGNRPFRIYRAPMAYNDQYRKDTSSLNRYEKQRLWEKNTLKKI